jgi:hypothetical protein
MFNIDLPYQPRRQLWQLEFLPPVGCSLLERHMALNQSSCGLAICALISSGILIFEPLRHSSEMTLQFRSSHRFTSLY